MSWFVYLNASIELIPKELTHGSDTIRDFTHQVGIKCNDEESAKILLERAKQLGIDGKVGETITIDPWYEKTDGPQNY